MIPPQTPFISTSLSRRADEVQREMVRFCAGLDHWDDLPVVVEGWLRVFEAVIDHLQAAPTIPPPMQPEPKGIPNWMDRAIERDELLAALRALVKAGHSADDRAYLDCLDRAESVLAKYQP